MEVAQRADKQGPLAGVAYDGRTIAADGEGPAQEAAAALSAQGFNEGKGKPFGVEDIRYATKGKILYVKAIGWPTSGQLLLKSLAAGGPHYAGKVKQVELLGVPGKLKFEHTKDGLAVVLPAQQPNAIAYALKIVPA